MWSMRCNQFDYKWSILCLIRGKCLMKYVIIICTFVSVYSRKDEVNNWIFNWWQTIAIKIKLFLIFWQHLRFVYVFNKDKVSKCFYLKWYIWWLDNQCVNQCDTSPILGPFRTKFKNTCLSKITSLFNRTWQRTFDQCLSFSHK